MPNYQNGKIYTIRCRSDNNLIYVGSTVETLAQRLAKHRYQSKKKPHYKLYQAIDDNWDDWYIELFEVYPCDSKEELLKKEGEVIREIGTLNTVICGRTQKEYYHDNKKKLAEINKNWSENNKEKMKQYDKEYREKNKEKMKQYQKEYCEKNKEKLAEKHKEYREKTKEKTKEYMRQYYLKNKILPNK